MANIPVTGIALSEDFILMRTTDTVKLKATVYPEDATNKNIDWSVSKRGEIYVSQDGEVYARFSGYAVVTATTEDGGYSASCAVRSVPNPIRVTGIEIDKYELVLKNGEQYQLHATTIPANATINTWRWTFENDSDVKTITVDRFSGMVSAHNYGTARAIVTSDDGQYQAICYVNVPEPIRPTGVKLDATRITLYEGDTYQLNAIVLPEDATDKTVSWTRKTGSTSATISQTGLVKAVAPGTTRVFVKTKVGRYSAYCDVVVLKRETPDSSGDNGKSEPSKDEPDSDAPQPSGGGGSGGQPEEPITPTTPTDEDAPVAIETKAVQSEQFFDGIPADADIVDITSVGNTLIVATGEDIYYFLWKDGAYKFLGNQIPVPAIHFRMGGLTTLRSVPVAPDIDENSDTDGFSRTEDDCPVFPHGTINDVSSYGYSSKNYVFDYDYDKGFWNDYLNTAWGQVDEKVNEQSRLGKAVFPMFIRYAVRLYDGTVHSQSIPILLGAELTKYLDSKAAIVQTVRVGNDGEEANMVTVLGSVVKIADGYSIVMNTSGQSSIFDGWDDIITSLDIFVSPQMKPLQRNAAKFDMKYVSEESILGGKVRQYNIENFVADPYYTEENQEKLLLNYQNTYLVKSYTVDEFKRISGDVTLNFDTSSDYIMAQEAMKETPQSMHYNRGERLFTYNNRLLIAGAKQSLSHGYQFLHSVKWVNSGNNNVPKYRFIYHLRSESGENTVICRDQNAQSLIAPKRKAIASGTSTQYDEVPIAWFAYPDSRCYQIDIYIVNGQTITYNTYKTAVMDQADVAYVFFGFGKTGYAAMYASSLPNDENTVSDRPNTMLVSKSNNPFAFPAQDSVTLAVGNIMNIAVATIPLSEGQFGQFPLYLFTDEGVFAMTVNTDGSLRASHNVSRDVLISKGALAGIEQGVFFASGRGLLLLRGSTVTKVSSEMDGYPDALVGKLAADVNALVGSDMETPQPLQKFLAGCFLAYDYANARIIVANPDYTTQYVYKMDTQSWHRLSVGVAPVRALNSFPEAQIVMKGSKQTVLNYSVLAENSGATALPGVIYSRDLAIDSADIYKTISRLKVRGRYANGHVKWQLQGSNDGVNYTTIHSLRGPSWKWFRIAIVSLLEPNERISYIELDYTPKFTDKIR